VETVNSTTKKIDKKNAKIFVLLIFIFGLVAFFSYLIENYEPIISDKPEPILEGWEEIKIVD